MCNSFSSVVIWEASLHVCGVSSDNPNLVFGWLLTFTSLPTKSLKQGVTRLFKLPPRTQGCLQLSVADGSECSRQPPITPDTSPRTPHHPTVQLCHAHTKQLKWHAKKEVDVGEIQKVKYYFAQSRQQIRPYVPQYKQLAHDQYEWAEC